MRWIATLLLTLAGAAAQTLDAPPTWLTSAPDGVYALAENGRAYRVEGTTARPVAEGLSPNAPLQVCDGTVLGVDAAGELRSIGPGRASASRGARLSTTAGLTCDGPAVIAVGADRSLVRLERDGDTWRVAARAELNALPDARPTLARVSGTPAVAVLAGPTRRYEHGVLGDELEASSLLLLDARTLKVRSRLDLDAPLVFEDLTARLVTLPNREVLLALVQSGPQGGARLALLAFEDGKLRTRALGPDFGRPGRWLDPVVGQREVYAVHTPHIGGVLHQYQLQGGELRLTRLHEGVSTHAIGSRNLGTGLVLSPGVLMLPTQDRAALLRLQCGATCEVVERYALNAPLSTNILDHQGTVVVGDASGRIHFLR